MGGGCGISRKLGIEGEIPVGFFLITTEVP